MYSYLDKKCGNLMMLYCPSSAASVWRCPQVAINQWMEVLGILLKLFY